MVWNALRWVARPIPVLLFLTAAVLAVVSCYCITWFPGPWDVYWRWGYVGASALVFVTIWVARGWLTLALGAVAALALVGAPAILGHKAVPLLYSGWLTLLCSGLGERALRRLAPAVPFTPAERAVLGTTFGAGVLGLLVFALGLLHALYFWPVVLLLALLTVAVRRDLAALARAVVGAVKEDLRGPGRLPDVRLAAFALATLTLCGFSGLSWALAPDFQFDSMHYHLGVPQQYVERHAIVEVPETWASYTCHLGDMLYTLGLLLKNQYLAKLFSCLMYLLLAGLVYCAGARLRDRLTGVVALCLVAALPLVTWEAGTAYVDLHTAVYVAATLLGLLIYWDSRERGALLVLSVAAGFALGVKYNAAYYLLPIAGAVLARIVSTAGAPPGCEPAAGRWRRALADLGLGAAPAVLLTLPWLIPAWVWTGNPLCPFLSRYFWGEQAFVEQCIHGSWGMHGAGHTWGDFLRYPWDLTFRSEAFDGWLGAAGCGGLALTAIPVLLFAGARGRRGWVLFLAVLAVLPLALLFPVCQAMRYMVPVFPTLALLTALNARQCWEWLAATRLRWVARVGGAALALSWLASTRIADAMHNCMCEEKYPLRHMLGRESARAFLLRHKPNYAALRFVATALGEPRPRVLCLGMSSGERFYSGRAEMHCACAWSPLVPKLREADGEALYGLLRRHGIGYAITDAPCLRSPTGVAAGPAFFARHGELLFARSGTCVYRLTDSPQAAGTPRDLAFNGNLEVLNPDGTSQGWGAHSGGRFQKGEGARSGRAVAVLGVQQRLTQGLAAPPSGMTVFSVHARANQQDVAMHLRICWCKADGQLVQFEGCNFQVGTEWRRYCLPSTVPPGAEHVHIEVILAEKGERLWVDDLTFLHFESGRGYLPADGLPPS
ncbi:MAG: glycosyltransferase family 39 protein [Gemmataceae bacterium]|nr:glycosyltransferase family 39 protein [Gemmataceae bacterium]